MKYSDAISLVSNEVLDQEAWPDSADLNRKIQLLHVAAQAVAKNLPIYKLPFIESSLNSGTTGEILRSQLPSNLMVFRDDLGIHGFLLDDVAYTPNEAISYESLKHAVNNSIQSDQVLFSIDMERRSVFSINVNRVNCEYARDFVLPNDNEAPDPNSYQVVDYPFTGILAQRCVHIVASHVSGVTIRDNAAAQFHSLLSNFYGE